MTPAMTKLQFVFVMFIALFFEFNLAINSRQSTNSESFENANILNVHLISHTHDDPGWLKTFDEYYYGSNSSIYTAGVQYILDTVIQALVVDSSRKFVYVEMSFFHHWYSEQTDRQKEIVKALIKTGQLSFANGGWCMHDEANTHFISMIDQTTLGHRFLNEEFQYQPTVGWQIDPFGHSSTQASLLSAEVGFDALYFGRIDYEDHQLRAKEKRLEFLWTSSQSLTEAEVFTGVFSDGNYSPPSGFCFDIRCGSSQEPIIDDVRNTAYYNLDTMLEKFIQVIEIEKSKTKGNNIGLRMGSDFHYTNADLWYKNIDKLIKAMNSKYSDKYRVFYSTPEIYTQAKHSENLDWSVKTDDFFPYADCPHCYWSGYYTSRPTLKYFERTSSSFLQVLKQMSVTSFDLFNRLTVPVTSGSTTEQTVTAVINDQDSSVMSYNIKSDTTDSSSSSSSSSSSYFDTSHPLFALSAAVGLVNHHDAVTDKAMTQAENLASHAIQHFLGISTTTTSADTAAASTDAIKEGSNTEGDVNIAPDESVNNMNNRELPKFNEKKNDKNNNDNISDTLQVHICRLFNESICDFTMNASSHIDDGQDVEFIVTVYNPLPRRHTQLISVLLNSEIYTAPTASKEEIATGVQVFVLTASSSSSSSSSSTTKFSHEKVIEYIYSEITPPFNLTTLSKTHESISSSTTVPPTPCTLYFQAENVPALSSKQFIIQIKLNSINHMNIPFSHTTTSSTIPIPAQMLIETKRIYRPNTHVDLSDFSIHSNTMTIHFDGNTGMMSRVSRNISVNPSTTDTDRDTVTNISIELKQKYAYYISHNGEAEKKNTKKQSNGNRDGNIEKSNSNSEKSNSNSEKDTRDPHIKNISPNHHVAHPDAVSSTQASGAYIFRPQIFSSHDEEDNAVSILDIHNNGVGEVSIIQGKLVSEVRQLFASWLTQIIRLSSDTNFIDFDWSVGPIPVEGGANSGKEIISRFMSADVQNGDEIYTDSNGREFLKRIKNKRPSWNMTVTEPISGNYYPVTTSAFIRTKKITAASVNSKTETTATTPPSLQLSVLTDRAEGVASLKQGELELMIHRRILIDDSRGVDEPLNETDEGISPYPDYIRSGDGIKVNGKHRVIVSLKNNGISELRHEMDNMFNPFVSFYSSMTKIKSKEEEESVIQTQSTVNVNIKEQQQQEQQQEQAVIKSSTSSSHDLLLRSYPSPLGYDLPKNIQLITLERWSHNKILLRLGHALAVDDYEEDDSSSYQYLIQPVKVDIQKLLFPLLNHAVHHKSSTSLTEDSGLISTTSESSKRTLLRSSENSKNHKSSLSSLSSKCKIHEMSLTSNQLKKDMLMKKLKWKKQLDSTIAFHTEIANSETSTANQDTTEKVFNDEWIVMLKPMQIRTFIIELPSSI